MNTRYFDAIVENLRASGQPLRDEDVARLSPLRHAHLNCQSRYAFTTQPLAELRHLRDRTPATTTTPMNELLIARKPEPDSRLPYLMRIPLGRRAGIPHRRHLAADQAAVLVDGHHG